jgi:hypothetical protein
MQAKLFAWTNCSVAEFMLKLPFPPPFAIVRAGISQLKVNHLQECFELAEIEGGGGGGDHNIVKSLSSSR